MHKQIITGGGQIDRDQQYGIPGTGFWRKPSDGAVLMKQGARVPFPKGVIRNLRLSVVPDAPITSGALTLEIHSTGAGTSNDGTGLLIKAERAGAFLKTVPDVQVCEGDEISIKVESSFCGPEWTAFTYSFEFVSE